MFQLQKTFAENRFNSEQDYSLYVKTEKELKQSNESLKSENELLKNEKKIIQISYNQLKDQYSKLKKKQEEQESYYDHLSKNMDLKLSEVTEERDNLFFELSQKKDSEKAFNEFEDRIVGKLCDYLKGILDKQISKFRFEKKGYYLLIKILIYIYFINLSILYIIFHIIKI